MVLKMDVMTLNIDILCCSRSGMLKTPHCNCQESQANVEICCPSETMAKSPSPEGHTKVFQIQADGKL